MNLIFLILLFVVCLLALFGGYVAFYFFKNRGFSCIVLVLTVMSIAWSLVDAFFVISESSWRAIFLGEMSTILSLFLFSGLFHFSLIVTKAQIVRSKLFVFFLYAPSFALLFLVIFFDFIIRSVSLSYWGYGVEVGWVYWIIMAFVSIFLFLTVAIYLRKYFSEKNRKSRRRLEYFIVSSTLSFIGVIFLVLILIFTKSIIIPFLSFFGALNVFVLLYVLSRYKIRSEFLFFSSPVKIRTKITLPIVALALVVIFFLGGVIYVFFRGTLEFEIIERLRSTTISRADRINTFFEGEKEVMGIKTRDHHFSDLLQEISNEKFVPTELYEDSLRHRQEVLNDMRFQDVYETLVLNENGVVVLSTDPGSVGKDYSKKNFFVSARDFFVVSSVEYIEGKEEGLIPVSAPIRRNEDNKFLGIIVDLIEKDELIGILVDRTGLGDTGETYLVDSDFRKVTPLGGFTDPSEEIVQIENAKRCFEHRIDFSTHEDRSDLIRGLSYKGEAILGTHAYIPELDWCVLAEMSEEEALAPLGELLRFVIAIGVFALVIFYVVIFWVSKKITDPIVELRKGIQIIEEGNRDYRVGTDAKDEIGQLSRAFDSMTEAIAASEAQVDVKVKEQTASISKQKERIEGQQRATLNILEDVESEKEKSESLAHDLEKFKLAVDNASDHIIIADKNSVILYVNDSTKKDTGFSENEIVGFRMEESELWKGAMNGDFYGNLWKTVRRQKKVFVGELINTRKDGSKYEAIMSVSPVLDRDDNVIFFVIIERDVTKEKEIDRAKTEFVSLASHQLRTPLSAVNWYAEMLLSGDAGRITKKQKQYIEEIYEGNQRMVELVNALLNVSRIELGTFSINPEPVNILDIFSEAIGELKNQIREKKLRVKEDFDDDLPVINLDPNLMGIVFQNIISNAVKYTPEEGEIEIVIKKDDPNLFISVSDNGYGIPKNQHARIFEKLFRADNVREKETTGTGLGLYIVKSIVDQSGGKIWFESKESEGTTFYVTIPLKGMKVKKGNKGLSQG